MGQVHRRPIQNRYIAPDVISDFWEEVRYDERLNGCTSCMKGWECSENDRSGGERVCVAIRVEERVDTRKTAWGAWHGIVGWCQAINEFVPWSRAWQHNLDKYACEIHISKSTSPEFECWFG